MLTSRPRALIFIGLVAAGSACTRRNATNTVEGHALGESTAPGPRYAVDPVIDAQGTGVVSSRALSRPIARTATEAPAAAEPEPEVAAPAPSDAQLGVFSPPPASP
jgi:hypothetical protein